MYLQIQGRRGVGGGGLNNTLNRSAHGDTVHRLKGTR